jgi:SSS family solute:Na+ symporter
VNAGVVAGHGNAQLSVPLLFSTMFPSWFAGVADAAIIIGALVPAAIMSIAAANLFTRTIYKELFRPYASAAEETRVARLASLLMKVGALGFALELNKTFSINLQLLGGIWILQTFPSVVIGLFTRWFHRAALIIGWMAGMAYGTVQAYRTTGGGQAHFGASAAPVFGHTTYIAITALLLNLAVSAVLSVAFKAFGLQDGYDETKPADYVADPDPAPAPPRGSARGREREAARAAARAAAGAAARAPARAPEAAPGAQRAAEPAATPAATPAAGPAARGRPPWDPVVPWSLGGAPDEATLARGTTAAARAPAGPAKRPAPAPAPAPAKANAPDDDSTVVFDIPASLAGRRRSQERPLRRK